MAAAPKLGTKIHGMHLTPQGATCLDYSGVVTERAESGSFTVKFSDGTTTTYGQSTRGDYWKTEKGSWK